jgi:hypothetical protein
MTVSAIGVGNSSIVLGTPSLFRELLVRHIVYPVVTTLSQCNSDVHPVDGCYSVELPAPSLSDVPFELVRLLADSGHSLHSFWCRGVVN